jgi:hypothetical protein
MKTVKEIHNLLPEGDIRQYLSSSTSIDSTWTKSIQEKHVERLKTRLTNLQNQLKIAEADLAILTLTEQKGWQFFDVSYHVPSEKESANEYPPFIGTQEEFDRLFNNND